MQKQFAILIYIFLLFSCSNQPSNNKKEIKETQEPEVSTIAENQISKLTLDTLLTFNSEKELISAFGDNVTQALGQYPEGGGEYTLTIIFPDTKNQVEFIWNEGSGELKNLAYIKLSKKGTNWKTKEGVTVGTSLKELEKLNKKPFPFYGLGWDYGGTIANWNGGLLDERKIKGVLEYPNENLPPKLLGDREFMSNSEIAQKHNLIVAELTLYK